MPIIQTSLSMKSFTLRLDDKMAKELEELGQFYALNSDADTLRFLIRKEHRIVDKEEKEKARD